MRSVKMYLVAKFGENGLFDKFVLRTWEPEFSSNCYGTELPLGEVAAYFNVPPELDRTDLSTMAVGQIDELMTKIRAEHMARITELTSVRNKLLRLEHAEVLDSPESAPSLKNDDGEVTDVEMKGI